MAKEKIFDDLPVSNKKFLPFLKKIQSGYKDLSYHNSTHAADLCQTFYNFMTTCNLKDKCKLDQWDTLSYILAGACHDVEHPGLNN